MRNTALLACTAVLLLKAGCLAPSHSCPEPPTPDPPSTVEPLCQSIEERWRAFRQGPATECVEDADCVVLDGRFAGEWFGDCSAQLSLWPKEGVAVRADAADAALDLDVQYEFHRCVDPLGEGECDGCLPERAGCENNRCELILPTCCGAGACEDAGTMMADVDAGPSDMESADAGSAAIHHDAGAPLTVDGGLGDGAR